MIYKKQGFHIRQNLKHRLIHKKNKKTENNIDEKTRNIKINISVLRVNTIVLKKFSQKRCSYLVIKDIGSGFF